MTIWSEDELTRAGTAEELQITALRQDGSLRKPVTIWVVRLGGDLYIRSVHGRGSAWFRGVLVRHEGHIRAGGVDKNVAFLEEPALAINDQIDIAYRSKYRRYTESIVSTIVTPEARAATIKLVPLSANP